MCRLQFQSGELLGASDWGAMWGTVLTILACIATVSLMADLQLTCLAAAPAPCTCAGCVRKLGEQHAAP